MEAQISHDNRKNIQGKIRIWYKFNRKHIIPNKSNSYSTQQDTFLFQEKCLNDKIICLKCSSIFTDINWLTVHQSQNIRKQNTRVTFQFLISGVAQMIVSGSLPHVGSYNISNILKKKVHEPINYNSSFTIILHYTEWHVSALHKANNRYLFL